MSRVFIFICCMVAVASAIAERQPFERYQTVVDRQMFGALPTGFDPTKMPSEVAKAKAKDEQLLAQEQEKVKKSIKFSVLNVTSEGEVVVGFSDNADPKNPLHYYLKVGESQNGWTVKEANPDPPGTMTIANKEGIEVTLTLGGDSASNAGAVSRVGANNAAAPASGRSSLLGGARSLRERRRLREEQIRQEESAKREQENAKRAEEDKAREAREEEARQQREAEREEQRKQLLQIQEELRKAREVREAQQEKPAADSDKEGPQ